MAIRRKAKNALQMKITPLWVLVFILTAGAGVFFMVSHKNKEVLKQLPITDRDNLDLNDRQRKVLSIFNRKEKIVMKDISITIRGVTKRTLRRDLSKLVDMGLIKQVGNTKDAKYSLIKNI